MIAVAAAEDRPVIGPIPLEALQEAARSGEIDPSSRALLRGEHEYIQNWRKQREGAGKDAAGHGELDAEPRNLIGLALSGGGIRSATFCLGIMQALARKGLLNKVDYVSTVSGGGYIGSSITWLLSHRAQSQDSGRKIAGQEREPNPTFGLDKENFPYGSEDPAPDAKREASQVQTRMLRYLRDHGYYLSPGKGVTAFSLLGVILRGTILNLIVWLPIIVLFFLFGQWLSTWLSTMGWTWTPLLSRVLHDAAAPKSLFGFELFLWIAVVLIALLLAGVVVYSIATKFHRTAADSTRGNWYKWRRRAEKASGVALPAIVLTLLVGSLPVVSQGLQGWLQAAGPAAVLAGMGTAIGYFLRFSGSRSPLPSGVAVSVAAGVFLYGVILVSFQIAHWWFSHFSALPSYPILAATIAMPALTGWLVNLNYISIHRYYRDRLMESYLPDIGSALRNETGAALGADGARLHAVTDRARPTGPFHLINTNLVLVDSENNKYRSRGGDNFILSAEYCGSNATGWCPTDRFMDGLMTLPTAMAISAAAVNPNTGVGGEGLTRNALLSLMMSLLNLRVGYWAANPRQHRSASGTPNHFVPGIYAIGSALGLKAKFGFSEERPHIQLTDGGHFENMAVYELVRRRAKLIIVCDGGADEEFSFSDFQTTVRRIEDDFGARLKIDDGATPDNLIPVKGTGAAYPKDRDFAQQGFMLGTLTYADDTKAKVIYLKATLQKDVSFKVKGYAAQNPDFPDQSTADQFFDEVQFESYRELGFRIADGMLKAPLPQPVEEFPQAKTLEELMVQCATAR